MDQNMRSHCERNALENARNALCDVYEILAALIDTQAPKTSPSARKRPQTPVHNVIPISQARERVESAVRTHRELSPNKKKRRKLAEEWDKPV